MRKEIVANANAADRARLEAVVADRNSQQKHVWPAKIILLTAEELGANAIMRRKKGGAQLHAFRRMFLDKAALV